ncbi:MAG: hypothetical protein WKG07_23385 [Hymenobacter sp.]
MQEAVARYVQQRLGRLLAGLQGKARLHHGARWRAHLARIETGPGARLGAVSLPA